MITSQGATHLIKHTVKSRRPDGGGTAFRRHTSAAFAGSGCALRYGNRYAWPLHLAAALTRYSRMTAGKHLVDVFERSRTELSVCVLLVRRRTASSVNRPLKKRAPAHGLHLSSGAFAGGPPAGVEHSHLQAFMAAQHRILLN
jgi:hypothetical protein